MLGKLRSGVFHDPAMVIFRADLQAAAEILNTIAAGTLLASPPRLADDFFGCVSFSFHENATARTRRQTLMSPGPTSGEHAGYSYFLHNRMG